MKTVFTNRELAHVWAGQKQQEGRGSHMLFDGPSIYSYGRHFEIARWVKGAVLFTSRDYSATTSKHKYCVRRAINHAEIFTVPSMDDHSANVCAYLADVETARGAALRAAKYGLMEKERAESAAANAARYVELFKKEIPAKLRDEVRRVAKLVKEGKLFSAAELSKIAASGARRVAADKVRAERNERQRQEWEAGAPARAINSAHEEALRENRRIDAPAQLERWANGADEPMSQYWDNDLPTRLRLKDGRIETSRGAQITERKARELWAALVRGADISRMELDNYTVTSWDGARLVVGCHDIPRAELERMALALELPGALPAVIASMEVK